MDNRIESSLGGYPLRIQWKSQNGLDKASKLASDFADKVLSLKSEKAIEENTAKYLKDACEMMFEFQGKSPDLDFYKDKDFPRGEFEMLQARFLNPTRVI